MENKEFSLKNYEDYKDYYEDATKEEIIADTYADYLAYGNTLQELSIANDKLKKIDKYCESTKEKYKYYNECNTTDVREILKIIKGEEE